MQPQVCSASVNLTTETAIVWPVSEAKVIPNWKHQLGEALAKHLTSCGFKSSLRGKHFMSIAIFFCLLTMIGICLITYQKAILKNLNYNLLVLHL